MARLEIEITALDKTSGEIRGIAKSLDGLDTKTRRLSSVFRRLESTLSSVSKKALKLGSILGAALSAATSAVGYNMVKVNAQFEKFHITLTTLYKDSAKAKQVLDSIMDFAARTPFEIDQLTQAWVQMKAMGLEPNLKMLEAIGDAVAALGGSEETFEGIVRALGQMQAKGKVSAEELMQLAERGIPAYEILQEKLGLTAEQVASIGKQGIEASKAIEALLEGMRERFGGNMQLMAQSWEGMISNLKDQWTRFLKLVGESGAFQALKKRLSDLVKAVDRAFDTGEARKWANIVGKAIMVFVDGATAAVKIMIELGKVVYAIGESIVAITLKLVELKRESSNFWGDVLKGLVGLFGWGVNEIAALAIEAGGWIAKELIAPLDAGFRYLWQKFKNAAIDAINYVAEKITSFIDNTVGRIPWLKDKIEKGFEPIIEPSEEKSYDEILQEIRKEIDRNVAVAAGFFREGSAEWRRWTEQNSEIGAFVFKQGDKLKENISTAFENIIEIGKETGEKIRQTLQGLNTVTTGVASGIGRVEKVVEKGTSKVEKEAKTLWDKLKEFFKNFWQNFKKSKLGSVLDKVWQGIKSAWGQGAQEGETGLVARFKNVFSNILSGGAVGGAIGAISAFLADQLLQNEKIRNALQKIFDAVQKLLAPVAEVIAPIVEVIGDILLELRPVFRLMAELLKPIASAIREILKLFTRIDDFFRSIMRPVFDAIESVLSALLDAVKGLLGLLKNPGKAITNTVEGIPIIGDIVGGVVDFVDSVFGGLFHQGGIVRPVVAHKGMFLGNLKPDEVPVIAQRGEFIVNKQATAQYLPLLQAINEGKLSPEVNITINIYTEKVDRETIEEEVAPILEDLVKRGKFGWV